MGAITRFVGSVGLLGFALMLSGCDYYLTYTIRNQSEEVWTGFYFGDCTPETEQRKRGGPLDDRVAPGDDIEISGVTGNDEADCVVVRTNDDEVVLIAEYVEFGVYVVRGSRADGEGLMMTLEATERYAGN